MNPDSRVTADVITPQDRKIRNKQRKEVQESKEYRKIVSTALDFTIVGEAKGILEAVAGKDLLTNEELSALERVTALISISKGISEVGSTVIKITKNAKKAEIVLEDGRKVGLDSKGVSKFEKSLQNSKGTKIGNKKNINKELHNKINTREKEYFLNLQADKKVKDITTPIDFDGHIVNGEINSRGKAVGGHSTLGNVKIDKLHSVDKKGIRTADISIYDSKSGKWVPKLDRKGKPQKTTLFPEHWTENRIKVEIDEAYKNKIIEGNMWIGETPSGIKIKGYLSPKVTAYPK